MKKVIVLAIVAMMVMALAVAANAATGVQLKLQADYDNGAFTPLVVGWIDGVTTNGKDTGWDANTTQNPTEDSVELDIVNSVIATTRVQNDYRLGTSLPQVWNFNASIPIPATDPESGDPTSYTATFGIRGFFVPGYTCPAGTTFKLYDGTWTAATAPANKLVGTAAVGASGTFLSPNLNTGQIFTVDTGSVHSFTLVASTVPEPGSMLALFSGLVGLVGFGIRRRK